MIKHTRILILMILINVCIGKGKDKKKQFVSRFSGKTKMLNKNV